MPRRVGRRSGRPRRGPRRRREDSPWRAGSCAGWSTTPLLVFPTVAGAGERLLRGHAARRARADVVRGRADRAPDLRTGVAVSSRRCRGPSRSHTSRRVPGRTRSGRSTARSAAPPRPSPRAGTGSSSWPPRGGTRPSARRARRCGPIRCRSCPSRAAPPRVLAVGEVLPEIAATRRGAVAPGRRRADHRVDARVVPLDVCHVHEPFAPSTSSAALRHSRALNVGTFHAADRADRLHAGRAPRRRARSSAASTPAWPATRRPRELLALASPPSTASCGPAWRSPRATRARDRGVHIVVADERSARRCASSCARCGGSTGAARGGRRSSTDRGARPPRRCARELRGRIAFVGRRLRRGRACSRARTSSSRLRRRRARARRARRALAAGGVPIASRAAGLRGARRRGRARPAVRAAATSTCSPPSSRASSPTPRCARSLRAPPARAARAAGLRPRRRRARGRLRRRSPRGATTAAATPRCAAGRQAPADRRRPAHAHRPLARLRDAGRGAARDRARARARARSPSPTTTRSPARSRRAAKASGIKVIVGEEVKTADQGEVIGLFLRSGSRAG